jgi:hypothetical protein
LIEVFVEQQRDFAKVRARAAIAILQRDAAVARARLDRARKTYETFRTESGVPDIAAEQRSALETLTRLKEKALTRSDAGVRGAHAAAPTPPVRAPETAAARDARRLEELRAELAAMRARSPENSRIPALEAQIAALRGRSAHKLAADTTTADPAPAPGSPHSTLWQFLSGEKAPSSEAAGRRGKEPPDALQAAQQRVTALAAMERAGQPLRADLEAAQSQLAGLEEALARAQDALETPHDDWRLLTPAVKPARPERANQSLIAAGMPLAGMLVALLVLLLRPILDARVYTAREAAYWAGLPVIASSGWPRNREMFFSLVDELGQQAVGASGYTLLVGATGAEKALAEDLAYWLGGGPVGSRRGGGSAAAYTEAAATTVVTTPHQSPLGAPEVIATSAGPSVKPSETLVIVERKPAAPLGIHPKGTHAWLGEVEGPALRRAARVADRVIVLLGSGTLTFTAVGALRTRLGRNSGVALIVLGLSPKLLELPDQAGDIGQFWHRLRRPGSAM